MANYLRIEYGNSCDLGNIYYSSGFKNILYIDAAIGNIEFEQEEEGFENGSGVFMKTSERLKEKKTFKTMAPEYLAIALKAMALCDNVIISDSDGLIFYQARNIEVSATPEDISNGCMYLVEVKFQADDQLVKSSCCINM